MLQILISACLIGENCKWDGSNNRNQDVLDFMKKREGKAKFHPVCPEQAGGLPTPRAASEIHMPDEAVMNTEGEDVTAEFLLGADFALREAKKYDCTIAILKERSPSCGSNGIYDGKDCGAACRVWTESVRGEPTEGTGSSDQQRRAHLMV